MEEFKALEDILKPDSRMGVKCEDNEDSYVGLSYHHERVASHVLSSKTPNTVLSQFNVSKNVLLYAYFSYNFYTVASQHAYSVLELALRERTDATGCGNIKKIEGMFKLVSHAIDQGWVKNEDFSAYHEAPYLKVKKEYVRKKTLEMEEKGLGEITLNYDEVEVPSDNNINYLDTIKQHLNKIRNLYAHGTDHVYPWATWKDFQVITEFINALYDENHKPKVRDAKQILNGKRILKIVGRAQGKGGETLTIKWKG